MKKRETKIFTCPLCSDYEGGQEIAFNRHLASVHGTDVQTLYLDLKRAENITVYNTCRCGCGQPTKWYGWHLGYSEYLRGHNATVDTIFTHKEFIDRETKRKIEAALPSWNKGLTKETSEKMASMASKTSATLQRICSAEDYVNWQHIDKEKAALTKAKTIATKKRLFKSGDLVPWNKGLSIETSEILASNGRKNSATYDHRQAGKRLTEEQVKERVDELGYTLISQDGYRSRKFSALQISCKKCNSVRSKTLMHLENIPNCPVCKPRQSKPQIEIFNFVSTISPDAIMEDRKLIAPKELDILVPSKKFAIEFNGLHWHSDKYISKTHHSDKTAAASALGYRLFHIFEDEWRDKQPIVESIIRNRLGASLRSVGARKCRIAQVTSQARRDFFDTNHLDGDAKATIAFGLELEGELLACLSLRRPFHKKWSDRLEVARFACALNTQIPGALSRLTKSAQSHAKSSGKTGLLSYVDMRLGDGAGYLASGWQELYDTTNAFWWTDNFDRYNRFMIRADKEKSITQNQLSEGLGYSKIWGCPQRVMLSNSI